MENFSGPQGGSLNENVAERVLREFSTVLTSRGTWESHWQEVAERIWPSMAWKFNPNWYSNPGMKKNDNVFDSTASLALNRFGAILDSLLTPRNSKWHTLAATDPKLNKNREIRLWFEDVTRLLFHFRYAPAANFASQNQQNYKSVGAFGTGCLFTDKLSQTQGLRYKAISLGEIYFVENHQGIVDKAFRAFDLTIRQAVQKWGDKVPEKMRAFLDRDPEHVFHFVHLVEPREDVDYSRRDHKGMPFASYYVCKDENSVIEEGGFRTFPYSVPRYDQIPGELYGRSPAMDLLPAIKTLNEEKKTMLKQGQRVVDPVLLAYDDGVLDSFSLKPGAINPGGVTSDGRPLIHALPTGNLTAGKELMDDERTIINDGFLVSLFQILTESPQMTATEVLERTREKGILLAPTIGRLQSEYLGPTIDREIDLLSQQGLLPPMPMLLREARGEYKIIYDSPLTRAQRAEEASGLMRTIENLLQVVQITQDPSPLFAFNFDVIAPEIAEINAVPFHWMNSPEKIAQMKADRAQQQQAEQMSNAAPGAAAMMNASAKMQKAGGGGQG